jgi:hypothetical protein
MNKTDIVMGATSARNYSRHWRAKRLSWNAIGKIRYLFDGAVEYMDPVTLCYPQLKFNELRKALGFKQDSELTSLVEQSDCFRIVRDRETGQMAAFMTPLVPDRFKPTVSQEIIEPSINHAIFDCKVNALVNPNDRDRIAENLRAHKNGINMKVLLAGNVPQFHAKPSEEAVRRISDGLQHLFCKPELQQYFFGEFIYHYERKYKVGLYETERVLMAYLSQHLTKHMACRVGIENWPSEAIAKWVKNFFGPKKLSYVITEAHHLWEKQQNNNQYEQNQL